MRQAKIHQLLGEVLRWRDSRHRLNHGFDFFTEIDIGYPKYCCIGDLWMCNQQIFGFLGLDVNAAGDDHECRAIRQVEEPVPIQVTNITHRAHGAIR